MLSPLAERIRPKNLDDVVGQKHLINKGKPLRRIIESKKIPNIIFYGPSGVGKTTVAEIIAAKSGKMLYKMNATTASISDIKEIITSINTLEGSNGILLYLDEIQYFNKKQQQTLLEYIEKGNITLVASTTENPYFYIYNAILSRSTVFEFKSLSIEDIIPAIYRAAKELSAEENCEICFESEETVKKIAYGCGGDLRKALNAIEICAISVDRIEGKAVITTEIAQELSQKSSMRYDREGDEHYDILSAYQKSMRGSDPDAAIHYLARLLEAGDLPSACRRLLICACEDVGLANPQIIPIVKSAVDIAFMVGLPEARIPLADAVILVATSPKSNSAYSAINQAINDIKKGVIGSVPRNLQNKHFDGEDCEKKGQFYKYAHDYPDHYVQQQYLPLELKDKTYYKFGDNKLEKKYEDYWNNIKNK